jgi:hypothetical protein
LCEEDIIIGASDRMITSGDIQFEPQQSKIWKLTASLAIMTAGDSPLQTTLLGHLAAAVVARYGNDFKAIVPVNEVAELYSYYHAEEQAKEAARKYLAPFGLDLKSFLSRQKDLSPDFVSQVGNNMVNFSLPDVEAIIAGVDEVGASLYQIFNGEVICQDAVGFASIGAGGWHASSQFMFAGHARRRPVHDTMFLTYAAKKRAEVAPGVGEATDMFYIGPGTGTYTKIHSETVAVLDKIYQEVRNNEAELRAQAVRKVEEYAEEISREEAAARAAIEAQNALGSGGGGREPDDQKAIRGGVDEGEPEDGPTIH